MTEERVQIARSAFILHLPQESFKVNKLLNEKKKTDTEPMAGMVVHDSDHFLVCVKR